ncbi:MAG TPA: SPFH domain-containing protein [Chthonomonadaceae bacterium]|nr:SPFH domain-containing protein [Chthonomonadaceae bacterium]
MEVISLIYLAVAVVLGLMVTSSTFKVLSNWERAVILRLGKFSRMSGPGPIFLLPWAERAYRVDTRIVTLDVPRQEMMTRDNVPVTVDAIVLFKVVDPRAVILNIENYVRTTSLIAQTTLRSTIGQAELDELLSQRERINQHLQAVIDEQTEPYGVKVTAVEVRDVSLPETMKRAMAAQAEAEREKRAKVINAEGEFQAAERLVQAAHMMSREPAALQLRYLQSMREIASERSSMTILPIPIDLLSPFLEMAKRVTGTGTEVKQTQADPAPSAQSLDSSPETPGLAAPEDGKGQPALQSFSAKTSAPLLPEKEKSE